MIVISHRGFWQCEKEKNTSQAFEHSFTHSFGTETDIRDYGGELVISHDIANTDAMLLDNFLQCYSSHDLNLPLALNIKADGLQKKLKELIQKHCVKNYFVFDMSMPDTLGYLKEGMTTFTRQSEYEREPVLYDQCQGVWIDGFLSDWIDESVIEAHLAAGKKVALVSSELHHRPYISFWQKLKNMSSISRSEIMLCTDYPEEARSFFCDL